MTHVEVLRYEHARGDYYSHCRHANQKLRDTHPSLFAIYTVSNQVNPILHRGGKVVPNISQQEPRSVISFYEEIMKRSLGYCNPNCNHEADEQNVVGQVYGALLSKNADTDVDCYEYHQNSTERTERRKTIFHGTSPEGSSKYIGAYYVAELLVGQ